MANRILLLLRISTRELTPGGSLQVVNADSGQALPLPQRSFLLTLEREPDATYCRGNLQSFEDGTRYPIQSNASLFEALAEYVDQTESGDPA